ncbi:MULTISPECIES: hypothetical protein [Luteibacter]|uniref:hypothetical protein n=1 Tax=Luteibacter sp. dw_328 TaxID=2719796 RepID=UPI0007BEC939|nr:MULTISPECIES: hypothetical protein [Luteibacter]
MTSKIRDFGLVGVAMMAAVAFASALQAGTSSPQPAHERSQRLEIALVCDATTPQSHKTSHGWDPRFSAGRVDERCTDSSASVAIVPLNAIVEFDKFAESSFVALEINAADGSSIEKLFNDALRSVPKGQSRQNLVLLDGKIVVSSYISGPFQGTSLDIGADSEESAKLLVTILSGKAP